jgi:hypothetical protein
MFFDSLNYLRDVNTPPWRVKDVKNILLELCYRRLIPAVTFAIFRTWRDYQRYTKTLGAPPLSPNFNPVVVTLPEQELDFDDLDLHDFMVEEALRLMSSNIWPSWCLRTA